MTDQRDKERGRVERPILVDDLVLVRVLKRVSSLTDKIDDILHREHVFIVALPQPISKRAFGAKGHDHVDESHAIHQFLAVSKQRQNMRMIELSNSPGLALEETSAILSNIGVGIVGDFASVDFDRHLLVNACIFCQVDFTHASAAKQMQETVLTQP